MRIIINRVFIFFTLFIGLTSTTQAGSIPGNAFTKKSNLATGTLSGKIVDKNTNLPLQGATVYIADLKIGSITDKNGNYFFIQPQAFYNARSSNCIWRRNYSTQHKSQWPGKTGYQVMCCNSYRYCCKKDQCNS